MSQLRKHLKFKLIHRLRYLYQKTRLGYIGTDVWLDKRVEFMRYPANIYTEKNTVFKEGAKICACNSEARIYIGENTTIGYYTFIFASESIVIGKDCLIAPFVYLVDSNHQIARDQNINTQPNETAPIQIGDDVWVASNVTILKGVTIGKGAVIAANSVVNQTVPAFEIWGGTPAKKIGER